MTPSNGYARQLLRPARTANYRPAVYGSWMSWFLDGRPPFSYMEADRMRWWPAVQMGLRILRTPLYGVTWKVRADSAAAERWIDRELGHVYRRMMPKLCRHFEYGAACGEVTLKARRFNGRTRVHFGEFLEVHPRDAKPYAWQRGRRAGKLACLQVRGVQGGEGVVNLLPPHAFWFSGDAEFGQWWGRARLAGAYQPWFDLAARDGANDDIRLYYRKAAFAGPQLFYPPGETDRGDGVMVSNQDIAREIVEKFKNGGVLAIPNVLDDKGNPLWRWENPKSFSDMTGLLDYKKVLDKDILIGMGIPPELVEASTVGSGYSGRAIPAQVFFSSMDEEAGRILEAIDRQVMRRLVRLNFGKVGYVVEPDSLANLVARAGQPPGAGAQAPQGGGPLRDVGPRGGHLVINPKTGRKSYERKKKPRVRLSLPAADAGVSPAEARRLWDAAAGPVLVPATAPEAVRLSLGAVFDGENHPRETSAHDGKRPGEFAPKGGGGSRLEAQLAAKPQRAVALLRAETPAAGGKFDRLTPAEEEAVIGALARLPTARRAELRAEFEKGWKGYLDLHGHPPDTTPYDLDTLGARLHARRLDLLDEADAWGRQ